jgi:hypothetical protein
MRVPVRLLLTAALFPALTTAAVAQGAPPPVGQDYPAAFAADYAPAGSFLRDEDFATLRGSDGQPILDLSEVEEEVVVKTPGLQPLQPQPQANPRVLPVTRQHRFLSIIDHENALRDRPRAMTTDALDSSSYDPLGIRIGSFIALPSIELHTGFTSNAAESPSGGGSAVLAAVPELIVNSDWNRHALDVKLNGRYNYFADGSVAPRSTVDADARGRIDINRDWTLHTRARYLYDTQSTNSLDYPTGVDQPPGVNTYSGDVKLDGSSGRVVMQLRGGVTHTQYDAGQAGDVVVPQSDRDNTLTSAAARLGYEATRSLTPFVEGEISDRSFNQKVDNNGFNRASQGMTLRAGIAYSDDPILKGELALGWHHEHYVDPVFNPIDAMTVDAAVIWLPTRLTKLELRARTFVNTTTDIASPGSIVYDLGLQGSYEMRRNLTLKSDFSLWREKYIGIDGIDTTYEAGLEFTWKMNREAWLLGRIQQEYFDSAQPGGSYPTTTMTIGVKLQR